MICGRSRVSAPWPEWLVPRTAGQGGACPDGNAKHGRHHRPPAFMCILLRTVIKRSDVKGTDMAHADLLLDTGDPSDGLRQRTGDPGDGLRQGTGDPGDGLRQGTGDLSDGLRQGTGDLSDGLRQRTSNLSDGLRQGTGELSDGLRQRTGNSGDGLRHRNGEQTLGELLRRAGQKDWVAWDELVKRFGNLVLHTASAIGLKRSEAA